MTPVLIANVVSTFFMIGLTWFVQVVHYPLFPMVGSDRFPGYHERHSALTTWVVLPPMVVELGSSILLAVSPPSGASGLALLGALLAVSIWVLTALAAAPAHGRIGRAGLDETSLRSLLAISWVRTVAWSAHGLVVVLLLAAAIPGGG
ncbi:MAG: hypothetical protein WD181_05935 [Solirubrobacterales bacterium]